MYSTGLFTQRTVRVLVVFWAMNLSQFCPGRSAAAYPSMTHVFEELPQVASRSIIGEMLPGVVFHWWPSEASTHVESPERNS